MDDMTPLDMDRRLRDWVAAGLISDEQAAAIMTHERGQADREAVRGGADAVRRGDETIPVVVEVLGYLGAAMGVGAAGLLLSRFWDRITPAGHLLLLALLTMVLVAAGWVLRERESPRLQRLASLLWLGAVTGVAFTVGSAIEDAVVDVSDETATAAVSGLTALAATGLYLLRRTTLQQIAVVVPVATTLVSTMAARSLFTDAIAFGLLLWALGVAWLLLAHGGWLPPHRTAEALGLVLVGLGSQVASVGDHMGWGLTLAIVSTVAVVAIALVRDQLLWLAFGAVGALVFIPQAVLHVFGDSLGAPLALLLTGLLLVVTAIGLAGARREIVGEET